MSPTGRFRTSAVLTAMSALPQIALQNSKNGFQRFLREKSNQAIIAGHAHLDRALITAQLTGGVYVPRAVLLVHSSAPA